MPAGRAARINENKQRLLDNKVEHAQKLGRFIMSMMQQKAAKELKPNGFVRVKDQRMLQVYIKLKEINEADLEELREQDVQIEIINKSLGKIQAWVDIGRLESLVQLPNVVSIKTPQFARPSTGSINSQGDSILRADQLRDMGFRGQGIKVGIISDGANDWTVARSSGDLPESLIRYGSCTSQPGDPAGCISKWTCNEGTAMAEIIHDLAPDAQLAVAAVSTSLEFIQRLNSLVKTFEADIIVDDLGFFGEPFFEDGEVAQAVAALPTRILYISSAGNSGNSHYEEDFKPISVAGFVSHNFGVADNSMGFIVPAGDYVVTILQWNDRFNNPGSDYDLMVLSSTAELIGSSQEDQSMPGAEPLEAVCAYNPSTSDVANFAIVDKFSGENRRLEIFLLGSPFIEYSQPAGSVFGHAGLAGTLAVGTINASEPGNNNIARYSSHGPARIDHPARQDRPKPDLIAIDGVDVTGAGGFGSPFFGTSAAAPHVAGIAAQLMSVTKRVTAKNVKAAMTQGAIDLGSSGRDSTYGYGRIDAVNAKNLLKNGLVLPPFLILLDED